MPLPGYRLNPVTVTFPEDLERATRHVARPSPGQASAGNYRKAHVSVGGLDITIETPKEGMRRGVGPDGTPWAVQILADYGYVKRTTGADDDHVDVYLGPNSHEAQVLPVWVVDQCDADSRAWDEHKCMLGFPHRDAARSVYLGGFSDGRGHHRIGAVSQMSFDTFSNWLKTGQTKKPIAYRIGVKSASSDVISVTYGALYGRVSGGPMTPVNDGKPAQPDPRQAGFFARMMSKALSSMSPAERTEALQDAAALAGAELGKADNMSTIGPNTGFIEDHWSDSGTQDQVTVAAAHGPGSSAASGTIPVGPSQAASGNGAERMEPQYSRYAAQTAFQTATEKLGRDIMGIRGAMKSLIEAHKATNMQLEIIKSGASTATAPDAAATVALIEAAVSKALEPVRAEFQKLVSKAWDKKDEKDDKEDDEDAKSAAILAKADDKEKEKERDEESSEKSASATAAAELRLMAKARVTHARLRMSKALDYAAEDKAKAAQRAMGFAEINLAKAQTYLDESTALLGGNVGLSTQSVALDIAKAKKSLSASVAANQDIWPASTDKQADFGKAGETTTTAVVPETGKAAPVVAPTPPTADIAKAIAQIEAAASGMGMMTASVADLIKALSGQAKPVEIAANGERQNLPPVFALAKAGASDLATREAELARLRDSNVISFEDHDKARDALTRARMGLPEEVIKAMVDRLPDAARAVLSRSAAA